MYFSTFITGLSEVVKDKLIESIQDISIKSVQDGLIIYGSSCKNTEIISLRFLNNTFTLIKTFKDVENSTQSINRIIYYYNNFRIHTSLKMTPSQFNQMYLLPNKSIYTIRGT